jgi:predicted RND superfamily exporter protein
MAENNNHIIQEEERLARRYARFVMRFRWPILLFVLVATVLGATQVPKLDIRNDPDTLLPPSNRYVATNDYVEKNFGMGNLMVIGMRIKEGDIYQPWFINTVQEVHRKLEELPESRKENFITLAAQKVKFMGVDEYGLVFKRLIPTAGISDDPEEAAQQLAFLKEGLESNPVLAPMLLYMEDPEGNPCQYGENGYPEACTAKAAFLIADYNDAVKEQYLSWVKKVRDIMAEYSDDDRFEMLVAGEPYFLAYMLYDLSRKWWLFVISILIVVGVLWFEFRNWRGAVFPLLGVGATIAWTLGLMGFSQFKLTTMMVLTPMLLLAIGIGHSVQITRRFMQEQARNPNCQEAGITAIEHTIIPATLSIVTDVVGFATLATVEISFYKAYAYFGMFGMFTLLLTTTTLIPLLLTVFPCKQAEVHEERQWELKAGSWIAGVLSGPGKWAPLAVVAVIVLVSGYYTKILDASAEDLMPGVEKGINYSRAAFKGSSITIEHLEELNRIMPGVISVTIPFRAKQPLQRECEPDEVDMDGKVLADCWDPDSYVAQGIMNDAEVLADMTAMEDWMRAHPFIGFTGSYGQYIKLVNMLLAAEPGEPTDMAHFVVPDLEYLKAQEPGPDDPYYDPEYVPVPSEVTTMYNGLLEQLSSPGDLDSFVDRLTWNEGVIMGFVNTMDPRETHQVVVDIQDYIAEHRDDAGFSKVYFGFANTADTVFQMVRNQRTDLGDVLAFVDRHGGDAGFPSAEDLARYIAAFRDAEAVAAFTAAYGGGQPGQVSKEEAATIRVRYVPQPGEASYQEPGLGGFLGATEATREVAWANWLKSPLQTALAVFIIAAIIFRSLVVAVVLVGILLLTLFAQYGLGGYFTSVENWSGNLAFHLLVTLSIAMGLGVDYSIYMISRLREEMAATGGQWAESLRNTLQTTGSAVIISVIVLLGSFIPLVSTELANTWGLGVYISEALVIDVFTALFLLPLLVHWLKPRYVFQHKAAKGGAKPAG